MSDLEPIVSTNGDAGFVQTQSNPVLDAVSNAQSLRSQILGIDDSVKEVVTIPEWNNIQLEFHSLSGAEKAEFLTKLNFGKDEESLSNDEKAKRLQLFVQLAIHTAYLPGTDVKVFDSSDFDALSKKSARALSRLEDTVGVINGFVKSTSLEKEVGNSKNS